LPIPPIKAVNTAADSENKIHDDRVAAQYGFRGGLVPGVTVYGYLAAAVVEHFGEAWLQQGAMHVRFASPVYEGEEVNVTCSDSTVEIAGRASGRCWLHDESAPDASTYAERALPAARPTASPNVFVPGTVLGTLAYRLDLSQSRMSAPLDPAIGSRRLAHPAVLLALANEILVRNVELGPWIHAASEVRNFRAVADGDEIRVRARIAERYERKGHEFVVLDVVILTNSHVATHVRHSAIWRPRHLD
jgi:acyl dehydratase